MFFRFLKTIATTVLFAGLHKEWTRDVTTQANRVPVLRNGNVMPFNAGRSLVSYFYHHSDHAGINHHYLSIANPEGPCFD